MKPTTVRLISLTLVIALLFTAMIGKLALMQIADYEDYVALSQEKSTKTYSLYGKRGTIYDTNMIPLAYDRRSYNVTFYRDPTLTSRGDREAYTQSIIQALTIIERNGKSINCQFWLERGEDGAWRFNTGTTNESTNKTRITQWRGNFSLASEANYPIDKLFDTLCENYVIPAYLSEEQKIKVLSVWQEQRMNNYRGVAITIAQDVGYECVCQIEAISGELIGIGVEESSTRVYPQNSLASHTIGYISKITSTESMTTYQEKGYPNDAVIGASGIEASLEDQLSQYAAYRQGTRVVEINRKGKTIRELDYEAPVDGNNVILTLDSNLQSVAEEALEKVILKIQQVQIDKMTNESWQRENAEYLAAYEEEDKEVALAQTGALIAMDPNTGRVLAMTSYPNFDLSMFEGEMDTEYWSQLIHDERAPMYNRCISARDTPGSIFKMTTSLGALMEGKLTLTETISDGGYYEGLDTSRQGPRCWISLNKIWQHSDQTIVKAIAHSCNYFFYEIGFRLGITGLNKWAAQLGLTSKTGIELNGESTPFVGSQDKLYDADKSVYNQYTSKPLIAYNSIIAKFKAIAADRGESYDNDKMATAAKAILDLADSDLAKDSWTGEIYTILETELGIPRTYISQNLLGNEFFYMINDLRWTASETIMAAIGQSITQVTPISIARYVSTVANNGTVYNAQVVDKIVSPTGEVILDKQPVVANVIEGADAYFAAIREGMQDVSNSEDGTASEKFSKAKYPMAAKTGTSQRTEIDIENNAWLVTYAPINDPKIVVVVYVQNGYAGLQVSDAAIAVTEAYLDSLAESETTTVLSENSLAD